MVKNVQNTLRFMILALSLVWLAACGTSTPVAPPAASPVSQATSSAPAATTAVQPTSTSAVTQRPLAIGLAEPVDGILFYACITCLQFQAAVFTDLTYRDGDLKVQLGAAEEAPSVQKGTWKINGDGTMDTIWKLRKNVKWTDGTPMVADD